MIEVRPKFARTRSEVRDPRARARSTATATYTANATAKGRQAPSIVTVSSRPHPTMDAAFGGEF